MKDLEKLGISQRQFDLRRAICKFYRISDIDFFDKNLYLIDEKVLFARIASSNKHADLSTIALSSQEYEKATGLSDTLLIELFTLSDLSEDYFLKYLSLFDPLTENEDENEKE